MNSETMNDPEVSFSLSIVVPVYNSSGTLSELLERLTQTIGFITPDYEIVLVDDGSRDDSWAAMQSLKARYGRRGNLSLHSILQLER